MKMAKACGATRLKIFGDSQLVAQQVMNQCDAVNESMMAYKEVYNELEKLFDGCEVNHIRRLSNDEADVLANIGSQCLAIPPGVFWEEITERSTKPTKPKKKEKDDKPSGATKETLEEEEKQELVMMVQIPWMQAYISYILRKTIPDDPIEARRVIRRSKAFTVVKGELYKRSISGVSQRPRPPSSRPGHRAKPSPRARPPSRPSRRAPGGGRRRRVWVAARQAKATVAVRQAKATAAVRQAKATVATRQAAVASASPCARPPSPRARPPSRPRRRAPGGGRHRRVWVAARHAACAVRQAKAAVAAPAVLAARPRPPRVHVAARQLEASALPCVREERIWLSLCTTRREEKGKQGGERERSQLLSLSPVLIHVHDASLYTWSTETHAACAPGPHMRREGLER
ncbi:hypothetical protein QYE76_009982 [Lolium multiflorum]|uniref:RNase H type-1 domain-containing protein n=1 Tax=Lolium multiflorum TaxID=4521 RepID=A0AAD8TWE5_LOLMU|nr:hypothetical protein QYE76_009982 [Lolium multiflorum]